MVFAGFYEHAIDDKNRLAIPAKFRSRWDRERDGDGFMVVPGRRPRTLWLYPERLFTELSSSFRSTLLPDDEQHDFEEMYYTLSDHLEMDGQGRVVIPERILRRAELGREIVICGVKDHIEIHRREDFQQRFGDDMWNRFGELQAKARSGLKSSERQPGPSEGRTT